MDKPIERKVLNGIAFVLASCLVVTAAVVGGDRAGDAARHSKEAAKVIDEIMKTPDKAIPKDLFDKSQAIAVFPGVKKAAFIVGAREGKGVISRRLNGAWTAPAFYEIGGASFGAQIGGESTDYVMLIMNEKGLKSLMSDKVEIGAGVEAAAGPVGREASAATDVKLNAEILTYSRNKGAFIGASLKGSSISPDNDLNQAFYHVKADEVLNGGVTSIPTTVTIFPGTLTKY
jgi:lipid-binding SYLF domain-containing protein